jgi:hypothetical protein
MKEDKAKILTNGIGKWGGWIMNKISTTTRNNHKRKISKKRRQLDKARIDE